MPEKANAGKEDIFDIFIANAIYPDPEAIFTACSKSLEDVKDDCYIVLDTTPLLVPYTVSKGSLEQIQQTYRALIGENRLIIPGQVAREFARNRAIKIGETYSQIYLKHSQVPPKLRFDQYPLLESLDEYQKVVKLQGEINEQVKQYSKAIGEVLEHIRGWCWDDPVSLLYGELFRGDVILDLSFEKQDITKELKRRKQHNIPPGYKDSPKPDGGVGDLLIWYTILELGNVHERSVIFVSGDEKADWWHRAGKEPLYPRYELFNEFRQHSGGESFHMVPFSRFLDLYGASESIVQEVRREEMLDRVDQRQLAIRQRTQIEEWRTRRIQVQTDEAVHRWLRRTFPDKVVTRDWPWAGKPYHRLFPPDFTVVDGDENITAVEVIFARKPKDTLSRINRLVNTGHIMIREETISEFLIVIVSDVKATALGLADTLDRLRLGMQEGVSLVVGHLGSDGEFTVLPVTPLLPGLYFLD